MRTIQQIKLTCRWRHVLSMQRLKDSPDAAQVCSNERTFGWRRWKAREVWPIFSRSQQAFKESPT
ncbi:hypothetical protein PSAB6_390041 [Paraburkholderia sabiae]|nr:hypothetical protein PSAB6_390041 [Paraburkholderia sabiae]